MWYADIARCTCLPSQKICGQSKGISYNVLSLRYTLRLGTFGRRYKLCKRSSKKFR